MRNRVRHQSLKFQLLVKMDHLGLMSTKMSNLMMALSKRARSRDGIMEKLNVWTSAPRSEATFQTINSRGLFKMKVDGATFSWTDIQKDSKQYRFGSQHRSISLSSCLA